MDATGAHLDPVDGQAADGDGDLLPALRGVEEAQGGLGGDAHAAGVGEAELPRHHHLAWVGEEGEKRGISAGDGGG